jgi:hypothetical protein
MSRSNPLAYFDALAISVKLQQTFDRTAISEVHLFAYLACLLSLYRGCAASDWGYEFVATENGSPFSADLEEAIVSLVLEGLGEQSDRYLVVTVEGQSVCAELSDFERNRRREEFLSAACASVLALPLGTIRSAMVTDHDMKLATELRDTRRLLTETAVEDLHDAFSALSDEIGIHVRDLMVPAVVWLNYLAQIEREATRPRAETEVYG